LGQWRALELIELPKSILKLPLENQLAALPELMAAYRRRYDGACLFFGKLTGFKFVRLLDYVQYDAEGRLVGEMACGAAGLAQEPFVADTGVRTRGDSGGAIR
jgi:hypothetical protein